MARIAGVDLPKNKRIEIGLTYTESAAAQQMRFWQVPVSIRMSASRICPKKTLQSCVTISTSTSQ